MDLERSAALACSRRPATLGQARRSFSVDMPTRDDRCRAPAIAEALEAIMVRSPMTRALALDGVDWSPIAVEMRRLRAGAGHAARPNEQRADAPSAPGS
jgi:hypothetical protein